jgi:hypothetical protein
MDGSEDGVLHKHTKRPFDASARSSGWAIASTRLHSAVKSKLTRLGLPVAGAGGLGVWATAGAHQMNPAGMAVIGATVVAGLAAKCIDSYIRRLPELIEKRGEAKRKAQSSEVRDGIQQTLMRMAAEDPTKVDHIVRMITLQNLSALPDQCQFTGREACELAALIAEYSPKEQPKQNPPDDETAGEYPRAVGMG